MRVLVLPRTSPRLLPSINTEQGLPLPVMNFQDHRSRSIPAWLVDSSHRVKGMFTVCLPQNDQH